MQQPSGLVFTPAPLDLLFDFVLGERLVFQLQRETKAQSFNTGKPRDLST